MRRVKKNERMVRALPEGGRPARGVYRSLATHGGAQVVYACTSKREQVATVALLPGVDGVRVRALLMELLDMADPISTDTRAHLTVVRGGLYS